MTTWRPPEAYVHGVGGPVVVVPARVCDWLLRHADLKRLRVAHRGVDPEVDSVLVAVTVAAQGWRSAHGIDPRNQAEVQAVSQVMSTQEAADRVGVTGRAVRSAISSGRLVATQVDGRWLIDRGDFEQWRAGRRAA